MEKHANALADRPRETATSSYVARCGGADARLVSCNRAYRGQQNHQRLSENGDIVGY